MHLYFKPQDIIKEVIGRHGDKVAIACSFGKASIVILHMALQFNKNIRVLFVNTGIEFPENVEYKNMIVKSWNLNISVVKPKPGVTFWTVSEKFGLPDIRKKKAKHHSPRCCYHLKEKPANDWYYDNKIEAVIMGLQASESNNRRMLIGRYDNSYDCHNSIHFCGQRYFSKIFERWHIQPLAHWSDAQTWDYIKKNDIPVNPVYTKWGGVHKRTGCLYCTGYRSWYKVLRVSHPKVYEFLKRKSVEYKSPWVLPVSERTDPRALNK